MRTPQSATNFSLSNTLVNSEAVSGENVLVTEPQHIPSLYTDGLYPLWVISEQKGLQNNVGSTPQKRTLINNFGMPAKGQWRTTASDLILSEL